MSNVSYTDPTPNNFPDDYDPANVDKRIKLRSESLKHKKYGKHTREALYQGLEIGGTIAGEAKKTADDAKTQSQNIDDRFNDQIAGSTNDNEVIDFRHSDMLTKSFETAKLRGDFWDDEFQQRGINVKWFEAKGDGKTDDTAAIQAAIDASYGGSLLISSGTFLISSKLNIKDQINITLIKATIKASTAIDTAFSFDGNSQDNYSELNFDKASKILGDNLENGITVNIPKVRINNSNIYNCTKNFILINKGIYEVFVDKFYFEQKNSIKSTGIEMNGTDGILSNGVGKNVTTGIKMYGSNTAKSLHFWIGDTNLVKNSIFCDVKALNSLFIDCFADTYQTDYQLASSNSMSLILVGCKSFYNTNVYTDTSLIPQKFYEATSAANLHNVFAISSFIKGASNVRGKLLNDTNVSYQGLANSYAYLSDIDSDYITFNKQNISVELANTSLLLNRIANQVFFNWHGLLKAQYAKGSTLYKLGGKFIPSQEAYFAGRDITAGTDILLYFDATGNIITENDLIAGDVIVANGQYITSNSSTASATN